MFLKFILNFFELLSSSQDCKVKCTFLQEEGINIQGSRGTGSFSKPQPWRKNFCSLIIIDGIDGQI